MQTISVKIQLMQPNKAKEAKMLTLLETYREACSFFAAQAQKLNTTSRKVLNRETYGVAKERFNLNTATLQAAMLKALSSQRSYLSRSQKGLKASLPQFTNTIPVMIRQDCYSMHQLPSGTWIVKFPVSSGRSQIAVPLVISPYHDQKLQDLARGSCRQGSMEIWLSPDGHWYVSVTLVYDVQTKESRGVIGVDLGIVKIAALSNNIFFNGRSIRWRKENWYRRRQGLQKAGRLSRVKKESKRERNWMRDINHKLSRQIVDIAKQEGKAIALERLTGIRERGKKSKKFNRMMSGWNFRELAAFIEYKAALAGIPVIYVDPKETSKRCPRCGNISRYNRKTQGWFKCTECGYQSDADRVGSINIASKALNACGV